MENTYKIIKRTPEHQKAFEELKAIFDEAQTEGLKYGFDAFKHYRELFRLEAEQNN